MRRAPWDTRGALSCGSGVVCYSTGMSIRCGHCKDRHDSVAEVRDCAAPAARSAASSGPAASRPALGKTLAEPGIYRSQGRIYRVSIKGSGRQYAEEYVRGAYVYTAGMVYRLRPEERMSLAECQEWGRAEVRCIRCATRLEKPESRAAGIGPVCATKI